MKEVEIHPGLIMREDGKFKRTTPTSPFKGVWQDGSLNAYGYRVCGLGRNKVVQVSRLMVEAFMGEIPKGMFVDHINGHRADNRISNLRIVTRRQNQQNFQAHREGKLVGCSFDAGVWRCSLSIDGIYHRWGRFTTEKEAHESYIAKLKALGEVLK